MGGADPSGDLRVAGISGASGTGAELSLVRIPVKRDKHGQWRQYVGAKQLDGRRA